MQRKCFHDPADRYPGGQCRACHRERMRVRREREAKTAQSVGGRPPKGWLCPLCKTPTARWICSPRCKSVIAEATLAGVDFRAYQGASILSVETILNDGRTACQDR